ncbi:MAG TPA: hypothetical protein DCL41_07090, partial [Bdellovibrionales bacterium]|nr:hypothetical protein [Bdellovibrionales bacterium]
PFFGICFGMQLAAIEFARNACGVKDATSREFVSSKSRGARNLVIDLMEEQKGLKEMGGTMRLGAYPCDLKKSSRVSEAYGENRIFERHRHRYEFNNQFRGLLEKHGLTLSGICKERDLVEIIEISEHPWFVGVQFHPEFKSRPLNPHPLFREFVKSSLQHGKSVPKTGLKKKTKTPARKKTRAQSSTAKNSVRFQ